MLGARDGGIGADSVGGGTGRACALRGNEECVNYSRELPKRVQLPTKTPRNRKKTGTRIRLLFLDMHDTRNCSQETRSARNQGRRSPPRNHESTNSCITTHDVIRVYIGAFLY